MALDPLDEIFYISGQGEDGAFRFPVSAGHGKIRQKVTDCLTPPALLPVTVPIEGDPLDKRSQLPTENPLWC